MLLVEQQSALALSSNKKSKGKAKTSSRSESTPSSSTSLAFPLSGTLPKEELDRAMYSLKRRFVDNVYVPGHCWFEVAAQSYPPTAGVLPKLGAPLFRRILSFATKLMHSWGFTLREGVFAETKGGICIRGKVWLFES